MRLLGCVYKTYKNSAPTELEGANWEALLTSAMPITELNVYLFIWLCNRARVICFVRGCGAIVHSFLGVKCSKLSKMSLSYTKVFVAQEEGCSKARH